MMVGNYRYICAAVVRDEPVAWINEWVKWHLFIGFDAVFLLDNFSEYPLRSISRKSIVFNMDIVQEEFQSNIILVKNSWWNTIAAQYHDATWLALLDIDEFLVWKKGKSLHQILNPYLAFGGLGVYWRNFGPEHYDRSPDGFTFPHYSRSINHQTGFKSIIRPRALNRHSKRTHEEHMPCLLPEYHYVNSRMECIPEDFHRKVRLLPNGEERNKLISLADHDHLWINHYHLRSREDWIRKLERDQKGVQKRIPSYNESSYLNKLIHSPERKEDRVILQYMDDFVAFCENTDDAIALARA